MAITKTIIKNRLQNGEDIGLSMEVINRQLCDNNIINMFVTAWLGVLEISTGNLVYINAGHNPPLVSRGSPFEFLVSPPDLVLAGMDNTRYHSRHIRLQAGDTLFLYTDGIVEAADRNMEFYGKERLQSFLNANSGKPLRELLHDLRHDIYAHTSGAEQSDDITMLAIRIYENGGAGNSLTLQASISCLDAFTAFIGKMLDSAACPRRERGQIELAAEEAFVNIAHYAYRSDEDGIEYLETPDHQNEVTVDCRVQPAHGANTMTLTFSDRGRPFNPLEHADPDINLPLDEREIGGLGLLIIKKTMDTIQYRRENDVNCLEFSKSWKCHKEEQ
jgi:sigma-B regulation protein RsbU (phosphoserine phosphatase)